MADTFKNVTDRQNPADDWFPIVPGPDDFPVIPRGIKCLAAGTITMVSRSGVVEPPLITYQPGDIIPQRPAKVTAATGTFQGLI